MFFINFIKKISLKYEVTNGNEGQHFRNADR